MLLLSEPVDINQVILNPSRFPESLILFSSSFQSRVLIHLSNTVSRKVTRKAQAQVQNAFYTPHQLPKWVTRPNPT
jgi:hypothetical protein